MNDEQRADPGGLGHRLRQAGGIQRRELGDARVDHEALEAEHSRRVQPLELADVARDGAAPEPDVDVRLARTRTRA